MTFKNVVTCQPILFRPILFFLSGTVSQFYLGLLLLEGNNHSHLLVFPEPWFGGYFHFFFGERM